MVVLAALMALVSWQADPTMVDLDKLVEQYKELHLPFPPVDAPLIKTGATGSVGSERPLFSCGYRISSRMAMSGTIVCECGSDETVEPIVANAEKFFLQTVFKPPFAEDLGLAMAVIERSRNHNEFALAILKRAAKAGPSEDFRSSLNAPKDADLRERMRYLALQHWVNSILVRAMSWNTINTELRSLTKNNPKMRNDRVIEIEAGLQANITPREDKAEIDQAITGLIESQSDGRVFYSHDPSKKGWFGGVIFLAEQGYKAIPSLIDHLDDPRLTRALHEGEMNDPNALVTVGNICSNILEQYIPSLARYKYPPDKVQAKAKALEWWNKVKLVSERETCSEMLERGQEFIDEAPIRWAEKQFPSLLVEAHNRAVDKSTKVQTWQLLQALVRSNLERKIVIDTAKRGLKSSNADQVHASTWVLKDLDKGEFDEALIDTLNKLPKTSTGEAWLSPETRVAQQAANSESPKVWAALLLATKRADVDLRLELLQFATYANHSKLATKELLKYMLAFFDDEGVASPDKKGKNGIPSHGHFDLDYTRVQDLVAVNSNAIVKAMKKPATGASRSDWSAFRKAVAGKIRKFVAE